MSVAIMAVVVIPTIVRNTSAHTQVVSVKKVRYLTIVYSMIDTGEIKNGLQQMQSQITR